MEHDLYVLKLRKAKLENAIHCAEWEVRGYVHRINNVYSSCRLRLQLLKAELQATPTNPCRDLIFFKSRKPKSYPQSLHIRIEHLVLLQENSMRDDE